MILVNRLKETSILPVTSAGTAVGEQSLLLAEGNVVRVDWSATLSSYLPANALVSIALKETSIGEDPVTEGTFLNFSSYDTIVPQGRLRVTGSATFEADESRTHVLSIVLGAYRPGALSGEKLTVNAIEMYTVVEG